MKLLKLNSQRVWLLFLFLLAAHLSYAQVLVSQEPRHHPVFQNDHIRILNVLLPPGDTSEYHIHHTPSVFIFLSNASTGSQLKGGAPAHSKVNAGGMGFENLSPPHTRVHRVWNEGKDTFHVQDIELLSKDTGFSLAAMQIKDLHLQIDTPWVRAYRLTLNKGDDFVLNKNYRQLVLISFNDAGVQTNKNGKWQHQTLKPGSFFAIKNGETFSIKNEDDSVIQFALLELP